MGAWFCWDCQHPSADPLATFLTLPVPPPRFPKTKSYSSPNPLSPRHAGQRSSRRAWCSGYHLWANMEGWGGSHICLPYLRRWRCNKYKSEFTVWQSWAICREDISSQPPIRAHVGSPRPASYGDPRCAVPIELSSSTPPHPSKGRVPAGGSDGILESLFIGITCTHHRSQPRSPAHTFTT